jgi:hypothetical protein
MKYLIWIRAISLIASFFFFGCSNSNNETKKLENSIEHYIDIENNIDKFKNFSISQLNNSITYIPLETTVENIIDKVKWIDFTDSHILIGNSKKTLLFSRNGKYIKEIGKQGKGPYDFQIPVSPQFVGEKIIVGDAIKAQVVTFDFEGNSLGKTPIPRNHIGTSSARTYWLPISETQFLIPVPNQNGNTENRIILINHKGEIVKAFKNSTKYKLMPIAEGDNRFAGGTLLVDGHLYRFDKKIRYKHALNDTIWQIEGDNLVPKHILRSGKYGTPNNLLGYGVESNEIKKAAPYFFSLFIKYTIETRNHIIFRSRYGNYPESFPRIKVATQMGDRDRGYEIYGIYNKQTAKFFFVAPSGTDYQLEPLGIENDIDGGINFAPMYSPNERTLVSWFNAMDLKTHVVSEGFKNSKPKYPEKKRELEALANRLKDTDNPVLMVVTLEE